MTDLNSHPLYRALHGLKGRLHLMLSGEMDLDLEVLALAEDITDWWNRYSSDECPESPQTY